MKFCQKIGCYFGIVLFVIVQLNGVAVEASNQNNSDKSSSSFEPMAVGNTWLYQVTQSDGQVSQLRRTITKVQVINGVEHYYYAVVDPEYGDVVGSYQQYVVNGALFVSYPNIPTSEKLISNSPSVGDTWSYNVGGESSVFTITSTDTVFETPAGSFVCAIVVNEIKDGSELVEKITFFFAKGVGVVRELYHDGSENILLSYSFVE